MNFDRLIWKISLPVMIGTVLISDIKPSQAGWERAVGEGARHYVSGQATHSEGRANFGAWLFGIGFIGAIIGIANKKR
jgi:hypothetical protein